MSSQNARRLARYLAGVAIALGLLAAFVGSPRKQSNARLDLDRLARTVESDDDNVTAVELGDWIRNRRANLRIVDVRDSTEFADYHIPTAERIALSDLTSGPFRKDETVVLYSGGDGRAAQGWVFLRAMGFTRVYFLKGGLYDWLDEVMNPAISPAAPRSAGTLAERRLSANANRRDLRFSSSRTAPLEKRSREFAAAESDIAASSVADRHRSR
jgi:rhodanese-related sulfurtransferase